jgi:hypothetical protein
MRNITEYSKLTVAELRDELVQITAALINEYSSLGAALADHQHDYLDYYVQSPGGSVAAKNREAQYNTTDIARDILTHRANINSLTLCRDLLWGLAVPQTPWPKIPFPDLASTDADGLSLV